MARTATGRRGTPPAGGDLRCTGCDAEFDSTDDLDAHRREAHGPPGADPARCPECALAFGTADALALHRRDEHGASL